MKKILIFATILLLAACGRSFIKMSDLQYKEGSRKTIYVFYDGDRAFDGEAWSDDGRSFKIIADCGIVKRLECFGEDGILFYAFECDNRTEIYFNENGNQITNEQARNLYPSKFDYLHQVLLEEASNIIDQRISERGRDKGINDIEEDNEAKNIAQEELSAAKLEISQMEEEVDKLFDNLISAKENSSDVEKIINIINGKYAKYYGFLLTENQDTSLYNAAREKVKSTIAVEILKASKQKALDSVDE